MICNSLKRIIEWLLFIVQGLTLASLIAKSCYNAINGYHIASGGGTYKSYPIAKTNQFWTHIFKVARYIRLSLKMCFSGTSTTIWIKVQSIISFCIDKRFLFKEKKKIKWFYSKQYYLFITFNETFNAFSCFILIFIFVVLFLLQNFHPAGRTGLRMHWLNPAER